MRRISGAIVLGLGLLGCGVLRGPQVPLVTVNTPLYGDGCVLLHEVVDVIADPDVGTVVKDGGWPLKWPPGYTAWRAGTEVEVRDEAGKVVLTTGARYRISPRDDGTYSTPRKDWAAGCIAPCPDCELGNGLL